MIGYALCASFCTAMQSVGQMEALIHKGYEILPILSENLAGTDTRFGNASDIIGKIESLCGKKVIRSIRDAEPIGPERSLEALVIAPCTGNTLSKIAHGITDTSVTMAAKAHLRTLRPLVIALATNDGLSGSAASLGLMLARKNVYFVPLGQDDPVNKPTSVVCDLNLVPKTLEMALKGKQIQPVLF